MCSIHCDFDFYSCTLKSIETLRPPEPGGADHLFNSFDTEPEIKNEMTQNDRVWPVPLKSALFLPFILTKSSSLVTP